MAGQVCGDRLSGSKGKRISRMRQIGQGGAADGDDFRSGSGGGGGGGGGGVGGGGGGGCGVGGRAGGDIRLGILRLPYRRMIGHEEGLAPYNRTQ